MGACKKRSHLLPVEESCSNFSLYRRVPASSNAKATWFWVQKGLGMSGRKQWTRGGKWRVGGASRGRKRQERQDGGVRQRGDSTARGRREPFLHFCVFKFINIKEKLEHQHRGSIIQLGGWKATKSTRIWIQCPFKHILSSTRVWDPRGLSNWWELESLLTVPAQRLRKDLMSRQNLDLV